MHQKSDIQRRKDALKWLATVRQAKVDETTAAAYLTGVADLPAWAVEQACKDLGFRERGAYEGAWPELGAIRGIAVAKVKHHAEQRNSRRLLAPPEGVTPVDPEKWKQFRAMVDAHVKSKKSIA